jgi:UDP-N-acetylmuramoyl-tripeptide--D-alanyl-D-alanine ligase
MDKVFLSLLAANFVIRSLYSLHMLQLEEYSEKKYIRWIFSHINKYIINILLIASFILYFFHPLFASFILLISIFLDLKLFLLRKKKKRLVFTKRLRRLMYTSFFLFAIFLSLTFIYNNIIYEIITFTFVLFNSLFYYITNGILIPIERLINEHYYKDAKRKISRLNPLTVAVTGSYGKTSTKYYLHHLVAEHYKSLMTPESYNTTMGITKTIREKLDKSHEVFIVELAENDNYGYSKLLELIKPQISILTSIGIQHFEEFESLDNIIQNFKNFILDERSGKKIIANIDDENIKNVLENIDTKKEIITCAINEKNAQYKVEELKISKDGANFAIITPNNQKFYFETNVYGYENIRNLLLAIVASFELKVPVEEVIERAKNIVKPKHRLEIVRNDTITVIDDTFNSNPKGFKMALEYLSLFENKRKILVTPGFVELGEKEDEEHYKIGKEIAKYVDVVFLIGEKRTEKIYKGLIDSNFEGKIFIVEDLNEVIEKFKTFLQPGDVVLFENDLPDNYN